MKKEIDFFLDELDGVRKKCMGPHSWYEGSLAGRPLRVVRTGIGRTVGEAILRSGCSLFVSTGFCGALSPLLARGDFVVSTAVLARRKADEIRLHVTGSGIEAPNDADAGIVKRAIPLTQGARHSIESAARELGAVLHFGATFTADRVIRTAEEKTALHAESGAISVDMEDCYRLEIAVSLGIPFLSVRVVLDGPRESIPSLRSAFRIPSDAAALLKGANRCARSLARFLVRFVEKFEMV